MPRNLSHHKFNWIFTGDFLPKKYGILCRRILVATNGLVLVEFQTGYRDTVHPKFLKKLSHSKTVNHVNPIQSLHNTPSQCRGNHAVPSQQTAQ